MCPCCSLPIENEIIPMNCEPSTLAYLGSTYDDIQVTIPAYFSLIKMCVLLFLIQFLISSFFNFFINVTNSGCANEGFICSTTIINALYPSRKANVRAQVIHNFMTLLVLIVLLEFFKIKQKSSIYQIEKNMVIPSDYAIQISGLTGDHPSSQISRFLSKLIDDIQIQEVYLLMDMSRLRTLLAQRLQLIRERVKCLILLQDGSAITAQIQKVTQAITEQQVALRMNRLSRDQLMSQKSTDIESNYNQTRSPKASNPFSGRAIVILNNAQHCKWLVRTFRLSFIEYIAYWAHIRGILPSCLYAALARYYYEGDLLRVKRAPEPSDINWMNIGSKNIYRRYMITFIVLCTFGASFYAILRLKLKIKELDNLNSWLELFLSLVVSTIVAITNTVIGIFIRKFAGHETHKKETNYYVSVGIRLSYLYFINMVLTTFFANVITVQQDPVTGKSKYYSTIQVNNGMMNDYFFLFITNSYLSSLFNVFDIVWGVRLIKRWLYEQNPNKSLMIQQDLNSLYEGHPVDMALRYANVLKLMFFTAAVSPLMPIGLPLSVLGLFILYWVDKYLLLRRYTCKTYLDQQLANSMLDILPYYTVFFSIGNLIICFQYQKTDKFSFSSDPSLYLAIIGIVIAVIYKYVFKFKFFKRLYFLLFKIETPHKIVTQSYDEHKHKFQTTYSQFYPANEYKQPL